MSAEAQPPARSEGSGPALTGRPLPRNPWSRVFLGLKAGLATAVALALDHLTGNPDHVSSTFIAAVCVSPVVLIGLRRARDQVLGSAVGGTWGTLLALAGIPPEIGIPVAVAAGVLCCFLLGFGEGYLLATFAALFVQAVPFDDPLSTLGVRALAVGTGAVSALAINVAVSAFAYRSIFRRRLIYAESRMGEVLRAAPKEGPHVARQLVPYLTNLNDELVMARREMKWRGEDVSWIDRHHQNLRRLCTIAHLLCDLDELTLNGVVDEAQVRKNLKDLLVAPPAPSSGADDDTHPLPEPFLCTLKRLESTLQSGHEPPVARPALR